MHGTYLEKTQWYLIYVFVWLYFIQCLLFFYRLPPLFSYLVFVLFHQIEMGFFGYPRADADGLRDRLRDIPSQDISSQTSFTSTFFSSLHYCQISKKSRHSSVPRE